jgi:hypothetical protein
LNGNHAAANDNPAYSCRIRSLSAGNHDAHFAVEGAKVVATDIRCSDDVADGVYRCFEIGSFDRRCCILNPKLEPIGR